MNNISFKSAFYLLLCCIFTTACYSLLSKGSTAKELPQISLSEFILNNSKSSNKKQMILANKQANHCQSIGSDYQEFYNFETLNHNISICHKEEKWFYYRKSKSDPNNFLFLPAQVVFGGDFFRATYKKTTYFVGVNSNGYYSSVMYGNNRIVFEPELQKTPMITKNKESVFSEDETTPKTVNMKDIAQNSDINTEIQE